ncbi:MAG: uroporphyrinogen-III synthase [Candidatus Omnitrophica bacterium]|nr:uroporphyrinogen-III synthase [Candidatus Omnitrophota bacterium]
MSIMEKLAGQRIVITRSMEDFQAAAEAVRARGGIPIACPMIKLTQPENTEPLDRALQSLAHFDWIFFTSPHAVQFFFARTGALDIDAGVLNKINMAAVGSATANSLASRGFQSDFTAETFTGENLFHDFNKVHPVEKKRFLLPLSNIARKTLTNLLREHGGDATAVTAYCNTPAVDFSNEFIDGLKKNQIDWVTFFSSSAVNNFYRILSDAPGPPTNFQIASIGPSTTQTLLSHGQAPTVEADPYTLEGLLDAIANWIR